MTPQLQAFAERDTGFQQFCDRYETVSASPETRREYVMWFDEALREEGMLDWARQKVKDEYEPLLAEAEQQLVKAEQQRTEAEQQRAEAEQKLNTLQNKQKEDILSSARIMKNEGVPIEIIAKAFHLSTSEIEELHS